MKYLYTDGMTLYTAITFNEFPRHWKPRAEELRGNDKHFPSEWRGYRVRSTAIGDVHQICHNGKLSEFVRGQVLLVAEDVGEKPRFRFNDAETLGDDFHQIPVVEVTPGEIRPVQRVTRDQIQQAMNCSGFDKIKHCCPAELQKHCGGDEYKGNLEGFVGALMEVLAKAQK